jgi:cytidylate kinase
MAIITISRGSMSGGEALAECLHQRLGYPLLGREVLVEAAAKLGVPEETLTQKFEKSPGLWSRLTESRRLYLVAIQAAIAERAASGDLIYHGHAGHMLLQGVPNVLRVRLIAPMEMRIRTVMERQGLTREAAVDYIETVDAERVRWSKFIYGVDWTDPGLYDLVLNLEKMSLETACSVVAQVILRPEFETTEALKPLLKDFLLACRVKLALASNPQTRYAEMEVRSQGGVVEIVGEMPSAVMLTHATSRDEEEILRTARAVPGVKEVRLSIRKFDAYH